MRLQSQSRLFLATERHAYRGLRDAFGDVWRQGGIGGLWRGASAAMIRVGVGSVAQLGTYDSAKVAARAYVPDGVPVHAVAAFASGLAVSGRGHDGRGGRARACVPACGLGMRSFQVTLAMNPFDVVSTRLYNQTTARYAGVGDCILQTARAEGVLALWKGT